MKIADVIIDRISQLADVEGDAKMATAKEMLVIWNETKYAYADALAKEKGWEKPNLKKTRTWFIESVCASVTTISHKSGYNRMRVADNVISRGYHKKHEVISFSAWLYLLQNLAKGKDGLIPKDKIQERLDWYYSEFDEFGKPPSTRDIENHYRKNGDVPEHELCLKAMKRNAEKLLKCKVKRSMKAWAKKVIKDIDLYFENGSPE